MNTTSDNRPINAQVDKQVDKRIEEPDKRRTPREKVVLSQNQARARRSEKELTNLLRKIYAQMATSGPAKITTEKAWTEVTGNSRRQKAILPNPSKIELEKRMVIFRQKASLSQKSQKWI